MSYRWGASPLAMDRIGGNDGRAKACVSFIPRQDNADQLSLCRSEDQIANELLLVSALQEMSQNGKLLISD